jgi:O-antigen/teichoic acid export membrane protein
MRIVRGLPRAGQIVTLLGSLRPVDRLNFIDDDHDCCHKKRHAMRAPQSRRSLISRVRRRAMDHETDAPQRPADADGAVNVDQTMTGRFGLVTFIRSAGLLSLSSISNLVRAIITAKLLALTLGPSMTGVLAQILNFSALLFQIIPLGLTTGVSKLVAESPTDRSRVSAVVGTSSALSLAAAITCAILMAPFSAQISVVLTGSPRYALPVILILASLPLFNLAGVLSYVVQGLADIRGLTVANISTAIASTAVLVPLTIAYGLTGATAAIVAASFFQTVFFVVAIARVYRRRGWPLTDLRLSRSTAVSLLHFGGVLLVAGIGAWGSLLLVRTLGVRTLGEFQNGIYQVVNGVSSQYMAVFLAWMAAYVFPRIVAEHDGRRLQTLLNSTLRANLLIMVSGLVIVLSLRQLVVRLLYSAAFLGAAPLLPIQVMGDYARIIGWSFGIALFAQGKTRGYLIAVLTQDLLWIVISSATLRPLGSAAIAMGYALSSMAWPALMYLMVRRWFGVRIDAESALLSMVGLVALAGAIYLPAFAGLPLVAAVPITIYLVRLQRRRQSSAHAD